MFGDTPGHTSPFTQTMPSTARGPTSIGAYDDTCSNADDSTNNAPKADSEVDDENDSQYHDLHSMLADVSPHKKSLEPMMLKGEDGIEGFWVDKHSKTAYHVSKIGPISTDNPQVPSTRTGGHGSPTRSQTRNPSQRKNTLEADAHVGGELPPMDPRRALEPERIHHLEHIAQFLYAKVGPLPEVMVRLRLRVFDAPHWQKWKQAQRDGTWAEAKLLIRAAAATAEQSKPVDQKEGQHAEVCLTI